MEYAPGRLADVFGDPAGPAILFWHGMQANARAVVRPLAHLLAGHGATVVVIDWDSHARDGGRADLLRSVEFMRQRNSGFVLVGWSMGGLAAAGLTLTRRDVPLTHTVCLAGAFMAPDPITGRVPGDGLVLDRDGPPFTLLHGVDDDVVPVTASRDFAAPSKRSGGRSISSSWRPITGRLPERPTTRPPIAITLPSRPRSPVRSSHVSRRCSVEKPHRSFVAMFAEGAFVQAVPPPPPPAWSGPQPRVWVGICAHIRFVASAPGSEARGAPTVRMRGG